MDVELLLIRYSEIGLKSTPVRRRFENQLKDNMMSMLARDRVESIISEGEARFYVESDDLDKAADSVRRVFGIASLSRSTVTTADMNEICEAAAAYSKGKICKGQSFAVRARREGTHTYRSMDVGREAGSAIFLANDGLKVDLNDPDVIFYVEVRNNRAYIFHEYIQGPGGLPLGSQGKVAAEVNDARGLLSAWLMMKRGCRSFVYGSYDIAMLERYDPNLRVMDRDDAVRPALGLVLGTSLHGLEDVDVSIGIPCYFPTIGMSDDEVDAAIKNIF